MTGQWWHIHGLQLVVAEIQYLYVNELSQEGRIYIYESIVPQFQWLDLAQEICSIGTEMTDVTGPWYTNLEEENKMQNIVRVLRDIKF